MKKLLFVLLLLNISYSFAQKDEQRITNIKNHLTALSVDNVGLTQNVKTEVSVNNITLANFLLAVSDVHKVNINVAPELNQITIANNFSNVTVADLLVFLCKEYDLTIDFTGNILSIKKYQKEKEEPEEKIIPLAYNPNSNAVSIDAKGDKLYDLFKQIMDETGKNLVFSPGLENKLITAYIIETPFDAAMDKLAFANNLFVEKTKDNFYLFEDNTTSVTANSNNQNTQSGQRPIRRRNSNFFFKVINPEEKRLEVDFINTPIANIINDIGNELKIDIFTATPLDNAGIASFKAKSITFDNLLTKIFETQTVSNSGSGNSNNQNPSVSASNQKFSFKKEGNIYFFGTENQLSVRKVEIISLMHRSVELLADPSGSSSSRRTGGRSYGSYGSSGSSGSSGSYNNYNNQFDNVSNNRNREQVNTNRNQNFGDYNNKAEALISILPDEIIQDLDIKIDYELNSFYVNGPSANIERFKKFIHQIDKPVPVVLIEVMLIEVSKSATVETGVSWGIGEESAKTKGGIFPETDITLGAQTINKVIGGFDGLGSFNLGQVVPNFFANIIAMETSGNIKIRSTPKLSTLNGHRATFSNGKTSYYAVTQRNIYGTDNPQTSEITNYQPIDAELGLTIKPLVSGDGQITLDIFVIQSSFGKRIAEEAPPEINSREFSSIIRVQDQDIVVLGGLEENVKDDSGSGVPFLARVPVIKWLFSKRKREDSKTKLTVLIKPTVIY